MVSAMTRNEGISTRSGAADRAAQPEGLASLSKKWISIDTFEQLSEYNRVTG